jgi:hypothetical protein
LISAASEHIAEVFRKETGTKIITIYNGFDKDDYQYLVNRERKKNEKITIAYTGTLNRNLLDPSPLFEAVGNLKNKGKISANNLCIVFSGVNSDVKDIAARYNLLDIYSYYGFLPREKALEMQYDADILLFLGNDSFNEMLTGKLFEYIYIAREIWGVGLTGKIQAGKIIEETNTGRCLGNDVALIEEALVEALENRNRPKQHKNMEKINFFERRTQAEKLLQAVEEL